MNPVSVSIQQTDHFPGNKQTWNTNMQVAQLLCSASAHPEWISTKVRERPPSGSQLLFRRYNDNYFTNDGYLWKRRREAKQTREDHMKLKVHKQEIISAKYAHSAVFPSFHRRVYWLTSSPEVVLVHYLNSREEEKGHEDRSLSERIASTIRASQLKPTQAELQTQLAPILTPTTGQQEIAALCQLVWDRLQSPPAGPHLERRNSCSSAFRKGLSSVALRRQPSTFSDSIDPHFIGDIVNNCGKVDGHLPAPASHMDNSSGYGRDDSHHSHSGDTHLESADDGETSYYRSRAGVSSRSRSNGPSSSGECWHAPIADVTPSRAPINGDTKILVIGGWYLKGHEYSVQVGDRKVPAQLLQVGVLSVRIPPARESGKVPIRVLCDGQIVSSPFEFTYFEEKSDETEALHLQALVDRFQLFLAAFSGQPGSNFQTSTALNEETFLSLARSMLQHQMTNPLLLQPHPLLPSRTILHLAAALDYDKLLEWLLWWRRSLPYTRELDPLARDSEGSTALHLAVRSGHIPSVSAIVNACQAAIDVLDDRGRTPSDLTTDPAIFKLVARPEEANKNTNGIPTSVEDAEHMAATALWVFTNGETVTDERRQLNRKGSKPTGSPMHSSSLETTGSVVMKRKDDGWKECEQPIHVEISMDTADVHVPDSPKMADLFDAVTSPGVFVNDCVREKMAQLAQHIIDALPERIKGDGIGIHHSLRHQLHSPHDDDTHMALSFSGISPMFNTSGFTVPDFEECMSLQFGPSTSHQSSFSSKTMPSEDGMGHEVAQNQFRRSNSHLYPCASESFRSSRATTFESGSFDLDNSKDLGEFLNSGSATEPLQQQLGDLRLSESEQRDVYEAAKTIQRAYREYRARTSLVLPHAEAERNAAITIQSFYRRYKAFQYFKQLYNAAILVQKHFRMKKKERPGSHDSQDDHHLNDQLPDHPSVDGMSIRIQVPPNSSTLLREHRAAATIQHAYRGHRKRQAAARKIQNFMRQSRIKLRKMHEQSGVACTMEPVGTEDGALCLPGNRPSVHLPTGVVSHHQISSSNSHNHHNNHHHNPHNNHHSQQQQSIMLNTTQHQIATFSTTTPASTGLQMTPNCNMVANNSSNSNTTSHNNNTPSTTTAAIQPPTQLQQQVQQQQLAHQGPLPPIHTIQPSTNASSMRHGC